MELTNCARSLDRRFDDPGADGRVEWVTVEIFHLQGLGMVFSHMLGPLPPPFCGCHKYIGPNSLQFLGEYAVHIRKWDDTLSIINKVQLVSQLLRSLGKITDVPY